MTTIKIATYNNPLNIDINTITAIRKINDSLTEIHYYQKSKRGYKKQKTVIKFNFFEVVEIVKQNKFEHFAINKFEVEYKPSIRLLRSDKTAYATLCPICNGTSQIYHTTSCQCRSVKSYTGSYSPVNNKLSQQIIMLFNDDFAHLDLKFNIYGTFQDIRTITIINNDDPKKIKGLLKIKGQEILLTPQSGHPIEFNKKNLFNNPQHWTWCYEELLIDN